MRKILDILFMVIAVVIGIPIVLIVCIGYSIYLPFDIVRYHKMPYYTDLKNKYELFITIRDVVKIYNYIAREKLPIEYYKNADMEYFVKDGEVLLCGWSDMELEKDGDEYFFLLDAETDGRISVQEIRESDGALLKPEHQDLPIKIVMMYDDATDNGKLELARESLDFYCIQCK